LRVVDDDGLRIRLGNKGSRHVVDKFSVNRLATDMANLYRELLIKKAGKQ